MSCYFLLVLGALELSQHVTLTHDEVLLALVLNLGACVLAIEDGIASLEDHGLILGTVTDGYDFALEGLFLGGVWDDDPAHCLLFPL